MRALALALVLAAAACTCTPSFGAPVDVAALELAMQDWQARGLPQLADQCRMEAGARRVTVLYASAAELPGLCDGAPHLRGCSMHANPSSPPDPSAWHTSIAIDENQSLERQADTLQHELTHWMLRCSTGDADREHVSAAWGKP